jgi:hypothetical protein
MGALIIYVGICILLGFLGRKQKWGFWGYFFGSIVLTPLIGLLVVLASDPKPDPADESYGGATPRASPATSGRSGAALSAFICVATTAATAFLGVTLFESATAARERVQKAKELRIAVERADTVLAGIEPAKDPSDVNKSARAGIASIRAILGGIQKSDVASEGLANARVMLSEMGAALIPEDFARASSALAEVEKARYALTAESAADTKSRDPDHRWPLAGFLQIERYFGSTEVGILLRAGIFGLLLVGVNVFAWASWCRRRPASASHA